MSAVGIRTLLPVIAQRFQTQWAIDNPTRSLTTTRIYGSNDPTYGAIGWLPPVDGSPFCVINAINGKATTPETNRVWMTYTLQAFVGIEQAMTPNVVFNFNDQALAWIDAAQQVIAGNRTLAPESRTISPTIGDVRWEFDHGGVREAHQVFEIQYYGALIVSRLCIVYAVNYETN